MLFLDSIAPHVQKAWEISPYNGLAFGALVVVLGFFAYTFYKDNKDKDEKLHNLSEKSLKVIAIVEEKLPDPTEGKHIIEKLEELKELIKEARR